MKSKEKKVNPILTLIIFIILIAAIYGIVNSDKSSNDNLDSANSDNSSETKSSEEEIIDVDYMKLYQDYQDNPIAADKEYKDKLLRLTGLVNNIDREIAGNTYITFDTGEFIGNIRLTFKKSEEDNVAELSKGQEVTVIGKCTGTLLSSTVALKDCYIEK